MGGSIVLDVQIGFRALDIQMKLAIVLNRDVPKHSAKSPYENIPRKQKISVE